MADNSQTRSEAASPRRREQARQRGQVASSSDLSTGLILTSMLLMLLYSGPAMGRELALALMQDLSNLGLQREWSITETVQLGWRSCFFLIENVALVLLAAVGLGILGYVVQTGFQVSPQALAWKPSRLSPASGLKKIFSARGAVRTLSGVLKFLTCSIAIVVVYTYQQEAFLTSSGLLMFDVHAAWSYSFFFVMLGALGVAVIGAFDFAFQRWQHEEDLKMTRQELKDETKENEGDPQVKGRMRKLQADAAKLRSLNEVSSANVVITNPTHISVAIKYERATMFAPKVVAKGQGVMAQRIRRRAERAGVPILERKPIARALFASTEVGQEIPASLYRAVAEILAHVYRLGR